MKKKNIFWILFIGFLLVSSGCSIKKATYHKPVEEITK